MEKYSFYIVKNKKNINKHYNICFHSFGDEMTTIPFTSKEFLFNKYLIIIYCFLDLLFRIF